MQHLEDGFLHEIADGEVPSEELVAVRQHLDGCESCRARLDQARLEAETARELVELIDVPALAEFGAVMDAPLARMTTGPARAAEPPRRKSMHWVRPLAWAASLVLAAGIGYASRREADAALSSRLEPTSLGRIDTVFLDIPPQPPASPPEESDRSKLKESAPKQTPSREPGPPAAAAPARQDAAGARAEEEQSARRRSTPDTIRASLDEVAATTAVPAMKKAEAKDTRDQSAQTALRANRPAPAAPSVAAENRLVAKSAADALAVEITFPRAAELLGGRIKLIEGMVPARLEAVGRTVRVIYEIGEGYLVLSQVSVPDSLNWSLSGPLSADSLAVLRLRVR
jgi:hypothetical protein